MKHLIFSTLALFASSAAFAEDIECSGQMIFDSTYDEDVTFTGEGICILVNGVVNGNVTIEEGAGLIAEGTTIDGNLYGDSAEGLNLRKSMDGTPSVVTGNVELDGSSSPGVFIVRGSTVEGNLSVSDWTGFVSVIGGDFDGNVEITEVAQRVQLIDTSVDGNMALDGNGRVHIVDSTFSGNVEITDTAAALLFDPGVRFPAQDNQVGGNLDCSGNGSVDLSSLQVAGSADGQCAQ